MPRKPPVFSVKLKQKRRKYTIRYRANIPNREAVIEKARKLGIKVRPGGGRPTRGGEPSEMGQFVLDLVDINSTVEINPKSKIIQFFYPSLPKLKKCVRVLERCDVNTLESLGPDDPLDTSFELTTIDHYKHGDIRYYMAKVPLYVWLDPETEEYIYRIPDREGKMNPPGTNCIYQGCYPVTVHTIDKDDKKGNRIITGEKVRWKAIQELKRIVREHPRFKPKKKI